MDAEKQSKRATQYNRAAFDVQYPPDSALRKPTPKPVFDKKIYDQEYLKKYYSRMAISAPKEKRYKERIKVLADRENISVNQWIIRAIEKELERYE